MRGEGLTEVAHTLMAGLITTRPDYDLPVADNATAVLRSPAILCLEITEATVFVRPGASPMLSVERSCEMAAEAVRTHHGSVLNIVPEMVIADFPQPADAVRAALEIQRRLAGENESGPRHASLELRIGIFALTQSEALSGKKQLEGDAIKASTKFARRAGPGQILISRGVHDGVSDDSDLQCQWVSTLKPDGAGQQEDVFEVSYTEAPACVPARYEVLSRVGTGGMGIVYKVRDLDAREVVALKILKPEAASNEAMQENLRREVFLARKVTHKNVCRIHEFSRSKGTAYISMEFIEGESLLRKLRRSCLLPVDEAVKIVRQICAGLREAHLQGIVHRDLKPANIMVDAAGNVKIMDFGIARLAQENVQHTGTIAGTPSYMAPEQVNLQPVGPRTDIYSLGLLLYEMVVGKQAFEGDNSIVIALKQLNEAPKRPREIVSTIPARVEDVILKCLEKDPAKRFQSIDEFEAALNASVAAPLTASIADAMETDFRRASQNIHALVTKGVDKARPAVPVVVRTSENMQRWLAREGLKARYQVRDAAVYCGGFYRRWMGFSTRGQAVTATVAVGFLLVGATAFALSSSKKSYAAGATAPVAAASPSAGATAGPQNGAAAPADGVRTEQVDFASKMGVTQESDALAAGDGSAAVPNNAGTPTNVDVHPDGVTVNPAAKASAPSTTATQPAATTAAAAGKTRAARNSKSKTTTGAKPAIAAATVSLPVTDPGAATSVAKLAPAPVVAEAVAPAPKPADAAPKSDAKPLTEPYLEIATYKDQLVADKTIADVNALGLHAFSVQKNKLWMESYHVEVGPFTNSVDMANAQKELSSKGFKPHPVK
jgi:serine/threonine-protein kinase